MVLVGRVLMVGNFWNDGLDWWLFGDVQWNLWVCSYMFE